MGTVGRGDGTNRALLLFSLPAEAALLARAVGKIAAVGANKWLAGGIGGCVCE